AYELAGVVVQVGLHGVAPSAPRVLAVLCVAAEALAELEGAAVAQVRDAPGNAEAAVRPVPRRRVVVVAALPAGVVADRGELRGGPADLVGRGGGRAGQQAQPRHAV